MPQSGQALPAATTVAGCCVCRIVRNLTTGRQIACRAQEFTNL